MNIDIDTIKKILSEIGKQYNYEMIITGSCADLFNTGYRDIDDIDLIIDEAIFNTNIDSMIKYEHIISLKSKIDGHILSRYQYKYIDDKNNISKIRVDFLIKNKDIIEKEIYTFKENDAIYTIISPEKRYDQLLNANANYKKSSLYYENKIKKVQTRIALYEKILFQNSRTDPWQADTTSVES